MNYEEINKEAAALYGENVDKDELVTNNNVTNENDNKPKKKKVVIVTLIAAIIAVIAISVAIVYFYKQANNYEEPLKEAIESMNNREMSQFEFEKYCMPSLYYETSLKCKQTKETVSTKLYPYVYEVDYHCLSKEFGEDFEVSYEILDSTKLTKDELEELSDEFHKMIFSDFNNKEEFVNDRISVYKDDIEVTVEELKLIEEYSGKLYDEYNDIELKKAYKLNISITISGELKEDSIETEITVYKLDDEWIIFGTFSPSYIYYSFFPEY